MNLFMRIGCAQFSKLDRNQFIIKHIVGSLNVNAMPFVAQFSCTLATIDQPALEYRINFYFYSINLT